MIRPFPLVALALSSLLASGCGMFSKKSAKPKESSAIAGETEATLRLRWVDRRTAELVAQGVAADAARAQAGKEFDEKYAFNQPKKK